PRHRQGTAKAIIPASGCPAAQAYRGPHQAGLRRRAIGHVRADLIARYNKDEAWEGRRDAFARVSDHIAIFFSPREGAAVILARGAVATSRPFSAPAPGAAVIPLRG